MITPVVVYFLLFSYLPMYGVIIAFKDYSVGLGIMGSPWVGLTYFRQFFDSMFFTRLLTNTITISVYSLLWGFPVPIIFALILNEFRDGLFKRSIQTFTYFPHFISLTVICGMLIDFLSPSGGIVNQLIRFFGGSPINFLGQPQWFRTVFIGSGIWQGFGFGSIIYIAAISGINSELYEAARIDGAGRFRQMWHVTLPGIRPTILTLLILNIGNIMSVGFERIILLYSPSTYATADVISTYVYRIGLLSAQYSYAGAIGLFNSVINVIILVSVNYLSKKFFEVGLW
jgi:putative aldouronate transport system permease protein